MFDYLIVGAGLAGSVLADRLSRGSNQRVLLVDRRSHIGGNAYDFYNDEGILVHRYGPHIFHTNSRRVYDYLSRFTAWRDYQHRVLASVDGQLLPFPINLDTVNRLYGLRLTSGELERFFGWAAEARHPIRNAEDAVVSRVGRDLYEKFFRGYTRKQWGVDPGDLDASVTARVPARTNHDDRYFTDAYQGIPTPGYTRMFENMLDDPRITVLLDTDYRDAGRSLRYRRLIYTGPIDEYFDFRFGCLPYRSLSFRFETLHQVRFQPAAVVNYPGEHRYTRITEFKQLTGQRHPRTTVAYEYPEGSGEPYYPVPRRENAELYRRYAGLAATLQDAYFVGRLATYRYYNMDQVVGQALALYARLTAARDRGWATACRP